MSIAAKKIPSCSELTVRLDKTDSSTETNTLFRFCFGRDASEQSSDGTVNIPIPLQVLGNGAKFEVWETSEPVHSGRIANNMFFAASKSWLMIHTTVFIDDTSDLSSLTQDIYNNMLNEVVQRNYQDVVRTWNYIPEINKGDGDSERYRQFSLGRAIAFESHNCNIEALPAGTAIGSAAGTRLGITILAAKSDNIRVENPRQMSAFQYPRQYGPRSPSFARAVLLSQCEFPLLLVSGTASILGHESVHTSKLINQAEETTLNIISLRDAALKQTVKAQSFSTGSLRIYVRDKADFPLAVDSLKKLLHNSDHSTPDYIVLLGDICRSDLLVEVEAVYQASHALAGNTASA